jgi:uncharacterized metal-binding protein YceD (DUF177 family)
MVHSDTSADVAPLGWSVTLAQVPAGGLPQRLSASPAERAAVAQLLGLISLDDLRVDGRVDALAGGYYRFKARLTATAVQACVVSLDPVPSQIDELVRVEFRPAEDFQIDAENAPDLDAEYDIEPIVDDTLETGRVIFEQFAASLDPYPRAPGAELAKTEAGPKIEKINPFAVLAKLKDKPTP